MTDLNVNGVAGPVVFLLSDPSYTEQGLLILSVIGGSSTNTVTLKPDSNVTSAVITLTDNSDFGGGMVLAAVGYLRSTALGKNGVPGSRNLTIQFDPHQAFPGSSFDAPVRLRDGCSNLTLENCRILSQYDDSHTFALPAVSMTTSTDPNNYITIQNNLMSRGSFGIRTVGGASFDVGLNILYNQIGGAFLSDADDQTDSIQICGIYYEYTDSAVVSHNQVKGVRRNSSATDGQDAGLRTSGIWQNYGVNSIVSYNVVDEVRSVFPTSSTSTNTRIYGVRIVGLTQNLGGPYPHTNNLAYNNAVSDIYGTGATTFRDFCYSAENAQGDFIYYNSMSLTGTSDGGAVVIQLTGDNSSSGDFTVMNNAFENSRTGNAINCVYRIFDNSGNPDLSHGNHNVLYSPATLSIDANGITWPSWIDAYATHPDSASSPHDPHFISSSNLHIDSTAASSAMNLAVPIAGLNDDIDGQPRSSTAPDAGSDEVVGTSTLTKDVMPVAFLSPTGAGFPKGLPVSSVTVRFRNNTLFPASYGVELKIYDPAGVEVSGSPFSASVPAHPAMSFLNVTIPTSFIPATDGFYSFRAISNLAGDLFPANDTASASFLSVPLIAPVAGYCTSFETDSEQLGWFGDNDFQLADFTKLGGPHSGTHAWVTNPGPPGTLYTVGGVVSHVYSPFFDFTGITTAYLSFYQSIQLNQIGIAASCNTPSIPEKPGNNWES